MIGTSRRDVHAPFTEAPPRGPRRRPFVVRRERGVAGQSPRCRRRRRSSTSGGNPRCTAIAQQPRTRHAQLRDELIERVRLRRRDAHLPGPGNRFPMRVDNRTARHHYTPDADDGEGQQHDVRHGTTRSRRPTPALNAPSARPGTESSVVTAAHEGRDRAPRWNRIVEHGSDDAVDLLVRGRELVRVARFVQRCTRAVGESSGGRSLTRYGRALVHRPKMNRKTEIDNTAEHGGLIGRGRWPAAGRASSIFVEQR